MELELVFRQTAFKHHVSEADIRHAFKTCVYTGQYSERENVYLLLGFNEQANPIEILYNEIGNKIANIFHAMPCRNHFLRLFKGE
jgi:hypothetical protein